MAVELQNLLKEVAEKLKIANIDNPRLDSRIIISEALQINYDEILFSQKQISSDEQDIVWAMIDKRIAHMPVCKIIGKKDFYKSSFIVNEDVLSPRPDTETLVEAVVNSNHIKTAKSIIDLGTGSGCILLSIMGDYPQLSGIGVDVSDKALVVAKKNAELLNISENVEFVQASWFDDDFLTKIGTRFDVIVSNPPYIPINDMDSLDEEVRCFDPSLALSDFDDGLKHYKQIAIVANELLFNKGFIYLEVGINQSVDVRKIFEKENLKHIDTLKDLGGIERCLVFQKI